MAEIPTSANAADATIDAASGLAPRPGSRLLSNSAAMAAANIAGRGVSYCSIMMMARSLDARYLGAYALLLTANMLIELVSNLGLDKILTREIARSTPEVGQGYFKSALPIRFSMAAISSIAAWTLLYVFFRHQLLASPLSAALFLAVIFPVAATRNCEAYLTAHERLLCVALAQFLERAIVFGVVVLLVSGRLTFGGLLCLTPLASLCRLLLVAGAAFRQWVPNLVAEHPDLGRLLRQGAELFAVEIIALVYFRSDTFFLARMRGLGDAGIYQIAYKVFDSCLSLFSGFLQAVFPRMVRDRSRKSLAVILGAGTGALMVPVCVIIAFRHLILGTFRPEYEAGATALVWLMLTVPLVYINTTLVNSVIVAGRVKLLIALAVIMLACNLSLNFALIPRWSMNGAAISTFSCELLSSCLLVPFMMKVLFKPGGQQ